MSAFAGKRDFDRRFFLDLNLSRTSLIILLMLLQFGPKRFRSHMGSQNTNRDQSPIRLRKTDIRIAAPFLLRFLRPLCQCGGPEGIRPPPADPLCVFVNVLSEPRFRTELPFFSGAKRPKFRRKSDFYEPLMAQVLPLLNDNDDEGWRMIVGGGGQTLYTPHPHP